MTHQFSLESETKINEIEAFLNDHAYLSGKNAPNEQDAHILGSLKDAPDRLKHPNFFAYWWSLALFQDAVRNSWGKDGCCKEKKECQDKKGDCGQKKGECNKKKDECHEKKGDCKEKKECHDKKAECHDKKAECHDKKPECHDKKPEAKKEEDDMDLFGDDDGSAQKELEALKAKKKEEEEKKKKDEKKKAIIAKSTVTFDVKGYEEGFDFEALGKKIREAIQVDGLVWQDKFHILPVAYQIKKLRCGMVIEDDKVSADDILEKIQDLWPDDIQSCDIVEFNKV